MCSKYNIIILSNIYDYIVSDESKKEIEMFMDYVTQSLDKLLLKDGKIVVTYQYGISPINSILSSLSVNTKAFKFNNKSYKIAQNLLLDKYQLETVLFPSSVRQWREVLMDDRIYIYKKEAK